ncbi:recombinase family protein [Candidatus Mycobacterium methanotrophicum]|uniref:Recombinase family protein n=1 Tax=Candidatus Mycobacterium methanotrophicum TaxID=2943498 RepID=A0ABY4QL16_9MYCO|nr:recombinase family protein [Candidatus Mycobacterium methanotrophicum]UQX10488.1 recombinase family protein [Candidatus Mycobacterium methanotrophicum]
MRAAVYTRISQDATGQRASATRQLKDCEALADRLGWEVTHRYGDDDLSTYSGHARPGFEAMLKAMADSEFGAVICWHPDRIFRSMKDLERLIAIANGHQVQLRAVKAVVVADLRLPGERRAVTGCPAVTPACEPVVSGADAVAAALRSADVAAAVVQADGVARTWLTAPGRDVIAAALTPRWSRWAAEQCRPAVAAIFETVAAGGQVDGARVGEAVTRAIRLALFGVDDEYALWEAVQQRQPVGGDDVVSRLARAAPQLTDEEIFLLASSVHGSGERGGVGQISDTFVWALLHLASDTGLAGKLRENPNDIAVFVEEIVRLHSTIQYPLRVALRDTRIGDLDLSAGDMVAIAAGAASRQGDGGDQVNERACKHWGFGTGQHRCRGNHLVRAALRVLVEEWLAQIHPCAVPDEFVPRYIPGRSALVELPLTWQT